jgi:thiol:disulfide interchange protein DsbD
MANLFQHVITWCAKIMTPVLVAMCLLWPPLAQANADYLQPEQAFGFSAKMADAKTVEVNFAIAKGYYLYREQFGFEVTGAHVGEPVIPPGKVKFDETFQKNVETYRGTVTIRLPVDGAGPIVLNARYQGCADAGLCYSPMTSSARLDPGAIGGSGAPVAAAGGGFGGIRTSLNSGKLVIIMPVFLLLGLGLAFTPCVLPMMPILSSIILGDRDRGARGRGLLLSACYSLGMAVVYTLLGIAAGLAGEGLAAALQDPWVLGAFAVLLVMLSLSMFGVYQVQMPASIQARLFQASGRQAGGKFAGVFIMGALSALIVGPCVAAPLAGTLVYISQTRDVVTGGSALFAMAAGMSLPLLALGASAGALLPRAGAWMESVKRFFGVLMLATALWMVSPLLPGTVQMIAWAGLAIGYAFHLARSRDKGWVARALGLGFAALGAVQLAGVATGADDPFSPLAGMTGARAHATAFTRVKSVQELDGVLAARPGKVLMLDFYADWCISCKEMEKLTFSDPRVQVQFADMLLLQVDVTANNAADKALLKRFGLFGPPGIIFFDTEGKEIADRRVIGYQDTKTFLASLSAAKTLQAPLRAAN